MSEPDWHFEDVEVTHEDFVKLHVRIADLQRALDVANEQLAEWQVIGSWKETALKAMADLDAERERADAAENNHTENEKVMASVIAQWQRDWSAERQARQQAEGERDVMRRSSEHNYEACVRAKKRLADAVGLLREEHSRIKHQTREEWVTSVGWDADAGKTDPAEMIWRPPVVWCKTCAFLDRVDASAEEPAAGDDGR